MTNPDWLLAAKASLSDTVRRLVGGPAEAVLAAAARVLSLGSACDIGELAEDLPKIHEAATRLDALVRDPRVPPEKAADLDAFRSKLRHDLRTPLIAIKGFGELIQEDLGSGTPPELGDALAAMLAEADGVLAAIDAALVSAEPPPPPPPPPAPAAEAAPVPAVHAGRILVVDDSEQNRDVLGRYLSREGHGVVCEADGAAALARLAGEDFDLVVLDLMMPGMNGDEVLAAIKADDRLKRIPVIMLSAADEIDMIARCIEQGAEDYLAKPFNPVLLRARVGACLDKKRLRDMEQLHLQTVEKELNIARDVQMAMLPRTFPPHPAVAGHGLMVPAREVGGDFYDFIPLPDGRIGIAVGDVSGKGVPAAFYMAVVRTLLRATAGFGLSPGECLAKVNDTLSEENERGMFVTLFYGILDCASGRFTYANGGHNWPVLVRADGRVEWVQGTADMLVGVIFGNHYQNATVTLEPGDMVFLYTDGVVEACTREGAEYGRHRLAQVMGATLAQPPAQVAEAVLESVKAFEAGAPQSDDITCVAVRWLGDASCSDRLQLKLDNRLPEVSRLLEAVEAFLARHHIDRGKGYPLCLALEEVVTNVIHHAYEDDRPHVITVTLELEGGRVTAEVVDDGRPFDPLAAAAPTLDTGLDERQVGGLGIHFVKTAMQTVHYTRDGGCNRLRFGILLGQGE